VLRIFLKIHRLGRVLNPQPLVPVASTITTTLPRRLVMFSAVCNHTISKLIFLSRQKQCVIISLKQLIVGTGVNSAFNILMNRTVYYFAVPFT
jgi:hypothetical protein